MVQIQIFNFKKYNGYGHKWDNQNNQGPANAKNKPIRRIIFQDKIHRKNRNKNIFLSNIY